MQKAKLRVREAKRFFRAMTSVLRRFGNENSFEGQVLQAGLNYVLSSDAGKMMRAENHVGLPY
jgi:p-hydroxybenzoate 3-monooxygenase